MKRGHQISVGKPMSRKTRIIVSGFMLLAATILGLGASVALYQVNREAVRQSDMLGSLLCGEGQHVDDVPSGRKGTRMICRDAAGTEVSARNNLIAINMALPFILIFAAPMILVVWIADFREVRRR
jgi:disulfide bond formation protein DsbB